MIRISYVFSLVFLPIYSASLLLVDRHNPCRAHGNGTVYDITNLVPKWPVPLNGTGFNGQEYIYWWSCAGKTELCDDPDVSVCQQRTDGAPIRFKAGNVTPQLWFGLFNGAATQSNLAWDIVYPNLQSDPMMIDGEGIRVTTVHFIVDPQVNETIITMDGEKKYTEYSITVRGKCIGQPAINHTSFVYGYCDPATGQIVPASMIKSVRI